MLYNLKKFPVSDDDTQLKDDKGVNANYRNVFIKALTSDVDEQGNPLRDGAEKFKRFDLYMKIKAVQGLVELEIDELAMLKKLAVIFPTVVAGQIRDFLATPEAPLVRPVEPS